MKQCQEFELRLADAGLSLRGLRWGQGKGPKVLGMHGWLDNAASMSPMGPFLSDMDFVVLDLPGHGKSDHLPPSQTYQMFDYVSLVSQAMEELKWDKCHILAHSLGACIAVLVGGTFPDKILSLTLIEGLGPLTAEDRLCAENFRKHIELKQSKRLISPCYPGVVQAARARSDQSNVDLRSAEVLAERGTRAHGAGVVWSTDPALRLSSPHLLTEKQLGSFLEQISCQTLLIRAENGWPFDQQVMAHRMKLIKNLTVETLPGSHHNHMELPEQVAGVINQGPIF